MNRSFQWLFRSKYQRGQSMMDSIGAGAIFITMATSLSLGVLQISKLKTRNEQFAHASSLAETVLNRAIELGCTGPVNDPTACQNIINSACSTTTTRAGTGSSLSASTVRMNAIATESELCKVFPVMWSSSSEPIYRNDAGKYRIDGAPLTPTQVFQTKSEYDFYDVEVVVTSATTPGTVPAGGIQDALPSGVVGNHVNVRVNVSFMEGNYRRSSTLATRMAR